MHFDDEPVRISRPRPLDEMSLDEIQGLITALEAEIDACKAMLKRKTAHKRAADDIFGAPSGEES